MKGRRFAAMILRKEKVEQLCDIQRYSSVRKLSELKFKPKGTSIIYLSQKVYDGHGIENLQIAAHEVGHFLNNKNNRKGYFIFKNHFTIFILLLLIILSLEVMLWHNSQTGARPWIFLVSFWAISVILTFLAFLIKEKDEINADRKALELIERWAPRYYKCTELKLEILVEANKKRIKSGIFIYFVLTGIIPIGLFLMYLIIYYNVL